ncbi:hypothetical protein T459_23892 [Capsicum annuum]|uniref:Uncharacterized protein n=1 Tax=Capsicum annuum TaxID=4072 RepID=A0A2G2YTK5_CAPAN|nr:hypothetical protein T459_23892 [Capsicum annuum]
MGQDGLKFLPGKASLSSHPIISLTTQFFDEQGYDIVENFDDEWNIVSQKKETGYQLVLQLGEKKFQLNKGQLVSVEDYQNIGKNVSSLPWDDMVEEEGEQLTSPPKAPAIMPKVQLSSQLPNSWQEDAKGLPLGLIPLVVCIGEVAGIRERKNALKEFPDDMTNDVFKVLEYNYDQFRDTTMQECFLYCALYPEDCEVDRDKLIGRFIMKGLDLKNLEKLDVSVCRDIEDIIGGEEAERSSQSSNAQITSTIIDLPKLIFPGCLI